jgi:hypothetical protein
MERLGKTRSRDKAWGDYDYNYDYDYDLDHQAWGYIPPV